MKNPTHSSTARFPRALVGTVLAPLALPALAFSAPQMVTAEVVARPGNIPGIDEFQQVAADGEGSWVATAVLTGANATGLYGVLSGSGTTTPSMLRVPQTLSGFAQENIFTPEVQGDRIAYTSYSPPASPGFTSWIDDTVVAAEGFPIGSSGIEWLGSGTPMLTQGQAFYVRGFGQPIGGGPSVRMVVRYPSEQIVLHSGMTIPTLSGPVKSITSFDPTPDGSSWAATITFDSGNTGEEEEALLFNGVVVTLPGFVRANTETSTFEGFDSVSTSGQFTLTFDTTDHLGPAIYRNQRAIIRSSYSRVSGHDSLNRVVTFDNFAQGLGLSYEGISLDRPGAAAVDADGDGDADPGWSLSGAGVGNSGVGFLANGELLTVANVAVPGSGVEKSLVKARLLLPDATVCDGAPNSTGSGAALRAVGSDVPTFSDLQLRATNVPLGTTILPLVSQTSGFVANPAGSAGNLCLSGAIGRGSALSATNMVVTYRVFPTVLPQPNGAASAMSGETWHFQAWYRDFQAGQATSNFTTAVSVTFR